MALRASWWLWGLVALQVAIPASYYLVRVDRDDERFAWRMFSSQRVERCRVAARESVSVPASRGQLAATTERARDVDVKRALHASWQRSLERGRSSVVEHFLASRCRQNEVRSALLDRRCMAASGELLPPRVYRYDCAARALTVAP